jgi:aspartyl aminopeptidase
MLSIGVEINSLKEDLFKYYKRNRGNWRRLKNISLLEITPPSLLSILEKLSILIILVISILNLGFKIVGAHTDSPCLRLAPVSKAQSNDFHQTCVSTYGGGLWHTWFDRDLILAGKVVYKNQDTYTTKLWSS